MTHTPGLFQIYEQESADDSIRNHVSLDYQPQDVFGVFLPGTKIYRLPDKVVVFHYPRCYEPMCLDNSARKSLRIYKHTEHTHRYSTVYETQDVLLSYGCVPIRRLF